MKQVKQFIRTLIMTGAALVILQGFIAPEITALADRPEIRQTDAAGLKMIPMGTQDDFRRVNSIRSESELAAEMMRILAGGGNMPAARLDGRGMDEGFAVDSEDIEIIETEEDTWGTIELPATLIHDDYSTDAYVGNAAPSSPYSEYEEGEETEEASDEIEADEEDGGSQTLKLSGIIRGERGALALIAGGIYMEGDMLGGFELVKIQNRRVYFKAADGALFALGM